MFELLGTVIQIDGLFVHQSTANARPLSYQMSFLESDREDVAEAALPAR